MDQKRAQEIVDAIHRDRWQWQGDTNKHFRHGERAEVIEKWKTMPGHTCFADALYRIAKGE
ncbi:MAG: hypothetical protein M0R00_06690 [Candidatus Omnitrophica bacterium]|jgi:hypothetical protein|nr:hypothetical protein [Candidatus Omnitrophota bacterium]